MSGSLLRRLLSHPATRGLDLDAPQTTHLRRRIIAEKRLLRSTYARWYDLLRAQVPSGDGAVLELGSGAGFLDEWLPELVRSEVFWCPWVDVALDGLALPFADGSLRAIVMTNVLHHLQQPSAFFDEAARCVRPGGVVAMIEPWNTRWSRWVYARLHHEPFLPGASWELAPGGPLSNANGALPWILFARDRDGFGRRHPQWQVRRLEPLTSFRYFAAGGVSLRSFAPGLSDPLWDLAGRLLRPLRHRLAMFACVVLERRPS